MTYNGVPIPEGWHRINRGVIERSDKTLADKTWFLLAFMVNSNDPQEPSDEPGEARGP
jgi:hypothetical protein